MKAPTFAIALVLAALVTAGCTGGSATSDSARFDPAGQGAAANRPTTLDQRAPAPPGAIAAFVARSYADPAAVDEMLAEAEAQSQTDQVIVTADVSGCALMTIWAVPEPNRVRVGYEFDSLVDCDQSTNYRALFIVDEIGTNAAGAWNYSAAPPTVTIENQARN